MSVMKVTTLKTKDYENGEDQVDVNEGEIEKKMLVLH